MTLDGSCELRDLPTTQGHEEVIKPLEVTSNETAENLFVEKLSDVKDVFAE